MRYMVAIMRNKVIMKYNVKYIKYKGQICIWIHSLWH